MEAAPLAARAEERLIVKRNLAAALRVLQVGIRSQRQRSLIAEDGDIPASVEFGFRPAEIGKRIAVVQSVNRAEPPIKIPAFDQPSLVVAQINLDEGAIREKLRVRI